MTRVAGLLPLLLLSPLFVGFVYLPYRQWRDHRLSALGTSPMAALATVFVLFALMAAIDWTNPLQLWLQTLSSPAAHRMLPAVWAMFSLPCWAVAVICCPHAARDVGALVSRALAAAPLRWFQSFGWLLLAFCCATFAVLVLAGRSAIS